MRALLARTVALVATLVAMVMLGAVTVWAWMESSERARTRTHTQAELVAAVVRVDADPEVLHGLVSSTPAGAAGRLAIHLPDGSTVGASRALPEEVEAQALSSDPRTVSVPEGTTHLVRARTPDGEAAVVEVFRPRWETAATLVRALGWSVPVALLAIAGAVALTDRWSRPALRALRELARTAVAIGHGRLNARIRVSGPRDLVVLGESINAIGERVQDLLAKEREMAADVSHRLRTPLTALRLDTESLPGADGERIRGAVAELERDVDEIIRNVRPRQVEAVEAECDLSEAVRDRMEFWSLLARDQGREVEVDLPPAPTRVALSRDECVAVLDALVEDAGPGFADPTSALRRGSSGGGSTGLGLDIVRHAVETTGGTVHLERGKLGGARVRSRFAESGADHDEEQPKAWRLRRSG